MKRIGKKIKSLSKRKLFVFGMVFVLVGLKNSAKIKDRIMETTTKKEIVQILEEYVASLEAAEQKGLSPQASPVH